MPLHPADFPDHCQRCGKKPIEAFTMSRFNTEIICMGCKEAEKKHPRYQEACDVELAAIKSGNMNYEGIGLPADLAVNK